MNSVLQQLFMIDPLRRGILGVDGAADNIEEELLNDEKPESEVSMCMKLPLPTTHPRNHHRHQQPKLVDC
jgi:hypothetical protein